MADNLDNFLEKSADSSLLIFLKNNLIGLISFFLGFSLIIVAIFLFFDYQKQEQNIEIIEKNPNEIESNIEKDIFIDISGAVKKPGVYSLKEGQRLNDALILAEGILEQADKEWVQKKLNLAQKAQDGQKIYIPFEGEVLEDPLVLSDQNSTKINLNNASKQELESLPNIGSSTADKIINERPYSSVSDLLKVSGIGEKTFDEIKELVTVN
ncbi:hypothetical protein GYA19_04800 [Candidatus Beckwithbacteria bacterium]|nr:hypothetical protein [Candidatus Beckwithbacteria bacterium]